MCRLNCLSLSAILMGNNKRRIEVSSHDARSRQLNSAQLNATFNLNAELDIQAGSN